MRFAVPFVHCSDSDCFLCFNTWCSHSDGPIIDPWTSILPSFNISEIISCDALHFSVFFNGPRVVA